jgi:MYXO-CTERM domain-containing protein
MPIASAVAPGQFFEVFGGRTTFWLRTDGIWDPKFTISWDGNEPLTEPAALSSDTFLIRNLDAVVVFEREGVTWTQRQRLVGSDSGANFGSALAMSGDQLMILGDNTVYVFARHSGGWQETQKFVSSDGSVPHDLALSGELALLSTSSGLHAFALSGGAWSFDATLSSKQEFFDLLGDLALAGTKVYERSASGWRLRRDFAEGRPWTTFVNPGGPNANAGRLFEGGALLSLNYSPYIFDGLRDPGMTNLVSFEVYPEPESCSADSDCTSSHCVEGVCCRTECSGPCQSCLALRKGAGKGPDGECGGVAVDTDPMDSCAAESESTCGTTGLCDGAGACALHPADTPCGQGYLCAPGVCRSSCASDRECDRARGYVCRSNTCQMPGSEGGAAGAASGGSSGGGKPWSGCSGGPLASYFGWGCALRSPSGGPERALLALLAVALLARRRATRQSH